ncbi:MAG: hypothetical protein WCI18_14285 [Pseudomonadota bacterium]
MRLTTSAVGICSITLFQLLGCTRKNIRPDRPIDIDTGAPRLTGQPVDVFIDGYEGGEDLPVASVEIIIFSSKPNSFEDFGESFKVGRAGKKTFSDLKAGATYYIATKLYDSAGRIIAQTQFGDLTCDVSRFIAAPRISVKMPVCKSAAGIVPDSGTTNINIKIETPK